MGISKTLLLKKSCSKMTKVSLKLPVDSRNIDFKLNGMEYSKLRKLEITSSKPDLMMDQELRLMELELLITGDFKMHILPMEKSILTKDGIHLRLNISRTFRVQK